MLNSENLKILSGDQPDITNDSIHIDETSSIQSIYEHATPIIHEKN